MMDTTATDELIDAIGGDFFVPQTAELAVTVAKNAGPQEALKVVQELLGLLKIHCNAYLEEEFQDVDASVDGELREFAIAAADLNTVILMGQMAKQIRLFPKGTKTGEGA